jgi:hypothetical protein
MIYCVHLLQWFSHAQNATHGTICPHCWRLIGQSIEGGHPPWDETLDYYILCFERWLGAIIILFVFLGRESGSKTTLGYFGKGC